MQAAPRLVKNFLFDFGNVLFDLDLPSIEREFRRLMGDGFEAARVQLGREKFFETWEVGGFAEDEFLERLVYFASKNGKNVSKSDFLDAWNSIFLDFPAHRLELLLQLRQRFGVFMLSNINAAHADWIDGYMAREHGHDSSWQAIFFDKIYYSHLIRLRKPESESFEHVLIDAQIEAAETLFIDDLPENIAAAERLGFQTQLHPVGDEVCDFLKKWL